MAPAAGTRSGASNSRSKVPPDAPARNPSIAPSRSKRKAEALTEPVATEDPAARKKKQTTRRSTIAPEEGESFVDPFSEARYGTNPSESASAPSWELEISVEEAVRRGADAFLDDVSPATNQPKSWAIDPALALMLPFAIQSYLVLIQQTIQVLLTLQQFKTITERFLAQNLRIDLWQISTVSWQRNSAHPIQIFLFKSLHVDGRSS
ncbi:hypothetical protein B0H13DRAFT_1851409 [Mycena leptocephala]|nr:hypothetical protein B0H13DRAFT_1851409 [Mycena leptocephala]